MPTLCPTPLQELQYTGVPLEQPGVLLYFIILHNLNFSKHFFLKCVDGQPKYVIIKDKLQGIDWH